MRILVCVMMVLGLLGGVGCQPRLGQSDALSSRPESSPTAAPLLDMPVKATATPDSITTPAEQLPKRLPPTETIATPDRMETPMKKTPERVPPTQAITPITGEVPTELLDAMLQELAGKIDVAVEQIVVTRAQAVVWNDGSLGCPQPGMMYTQALVDGYWVELEAEGQTFDYRVAQTGYFFLCESGSLPLMPPAGRPDS